MAFESKQPESSLKEILKARIKEDIIDDALGTDKNKRVYSLIVGDDVTIKILHHAFKMHELNDLNVGVIVNVKFVRERVKISPIYFLSPSEESIKAMIQDYDQDTKKPQYSTPIHVYFCGSLTPKGLDLIKTSKNFIKYVKNCKEIPCNFLVLEKRVFSFNRISSFSTLYINKEDRTDELNNIAQQLSGLCITMGDEPCIRYSNSSRLAPQLSQLVEKNINDIKRNLSNDYKLSQDRTTLLILDRADDPLTPLLYDLNYQSLIMDLLYDDKKNQIKINNDEDDNDNKEQQSSSSLKNNKNNNKNNNNYIYIDIPDENDNIWIEYRHTYIGKVVEQIPKKFTQWQEDNAVVQFHKKNNNNNNNTKDLVKAARDMPQYQIEIKKFKKHISIAKQCTDLYKLLNLQDIMELEEEMVTGITNDGKKSDRTKIQQKFSEILLDPNKDKFLKLRLFMIYLITQGGVGSKQRIQILEQGGFDQKSQDSIVNLGTLGVILQSDKPSEGHKNKDYYKDLLKYAKDKVTQSDSYNRYLSYLEWIVNNHIDGLLSTKDFPWIREPSNKNKNNDNITSSSSSSSSSSTRSYRKHTAKSTVSKSSNNNNNNNSNNNYDNRLIIYILGGMTYSEMKVCYDLSKSKQTEIYIGSNVALNPEKFLHELEAQPQNKD